jgi:benzoate membrane transport protein
LLNRKILPFHFSHLSAGFIAVLVGYTSSAAIVFQAAHAAGASPQQIGSWLLALGLGMGVTCIGLSLYFRSPILTAWSTPGAALLATSLQGVSMAEAIGAFLFSSALITLVGLSGWFDRLMRHVPKALASAMLAGVLLRFGMDMFAALSSLHFLVAGMLAVFLVARRIWPRYAVLLAFVAGLVWVVAHGDMQTRTLALSWARPVFTAPRFSVAPLLGVGLPLFIVTMASQNVPGLAVLRANGYTTPASPLIATTGLTGLLLAPWGGYTFNLAAITAAICMAPDADPNPAQRYKAAVAAGGFYLLTGLFGPTVASLFASVPKAFVLGIAGLALLGTIATSLAASLVEESERDAALITFLVTASGLSLFRIGCAFWGLALGLAASWIARRFPLRAPSAPAAAEPPDPGPGRPR